MSRLSSLLTSSRRSHLRCLFPSSRSQDAVVSDAAEAAEGVGARTLDGARRRWQSVDQVWATIFASRCTGIGDDLGEAEQTKRPNLSHEKQVSSVERVTHAQGFPNCGSPGNDVASLTVLVPDGSWGCARALVTEMLDISGGQLQFVELNR